MCWIDGGGVLVLDHERLCVCEREVLYLSTLSLSELARTHTKNATKPNPLEIIPLQPTRKENNWETEEAMERAAVTLET